MPSANVGWPIPLVRQKIFYPGQFGVPGTDNERGLRSDVHGTVFYVDPNATGVTDARDGTDPEAPLATVAKALTLCQAYRGDVIAVMGNGAWTYAAGVNRPLPVSEEVTITVPGVRLVGVFPSSALGVVWTPASDGGTCITVAAMDVLIEGFAFSEGGTYTGCNAIYAEWDGATLFGENLTVRNCTFDDSVDTAIQLEYSWYCDIHNNLFQQCDVYGIHGDVGGSGFAYCTIHDNQFLDCATAAVAALGGCDNNFIYRNAVYNGSAESGVLATNEGIDTTGGRQNTVYDNYLSCLLPVPANGDYDDFCSASATDAWINNHCLDGDTVTNPT